MISYLIDLLVNFAISFIGFFGYGGIFILMLLESCGVPIPSEVTLPFGGFLVAAGTMSFWLVVAAGTLGNLLGSLLAYWIGSRGGRPLIEKYGRYMLISKHDLDLADDWFKRYGNWTVFFGRLLPVIRTYISFPAGVAKMDVKKFSLYTVLGVLPWSILFTWLGVKLGDRWETIREQLHNFDLLIALVVVLLLAAYVWRHLKHREK
ncbi:MAG: DedA family protein [Patescibacteria group bacterium]|nr:DedA family protein [Patescibacteria group bacterium]